MSTSRAPRFSIRHLKTQNEAFLLKIGFNLVTNDKALWVNVLKAKYGMKSAIPKDITKGNSSALWRALAKVWPLLKENLCWSAGTREKISCWKEVWVQGVGPLIDHIPIIEKLWRTISSKTWKQEMEPRT